MLLVKSMGDIWNSYQETSCTRIFYCHLPASTSAIQYVSNVLKGFRIWNLDLQDQFHTSHKIQFQIPFKIQMLHI